MRCTDALLIYLQGEQASKDDQGASRTHLARCPSCAGTVEDLEYDGTDPASVLRALATHQATPRRSVRVLLASISVVQLLVALPWLFAINPFATLDNQVGDAHLTRDGAIALLVGAAGLLVAIRPRYATPAAVVGAVGVLAQFVTGMLDEYNADVDVWFEIFHLLTIAILVLTAVVAGSRVAGPGTPKRSRNLRLVPGPNGPNGPGAVKSLEPIEPIEPIEPVEP